MPIGTVKFFNVSKGYGFIAPDGGGNDAFVHMTAVERAGMHTLRENQRVSYDVEQDQRGKLKAANLKAAEDSTQSEPSGQQEQASDQSSQPQDEAQPADEA